MELTQQLVREYFDYKDGSLYWKIKLNPKVKIKNIASYIIKGKYCNRNVVNISGVRYLQSRLIFLYHHGYLPDRVDHEDRNTLNDRIENLRAATHSQNMKNRGSARNSTSKYLGVNLNKALNKWAAGIRINKTRKHLGYFLIEREAALAYNREAVRYHKEFANLNIIQPE